MWLLGLGVASKITNFHSIRNGFLNILLQLNASVKQLCPHNISVSTCSCSQLFRIITAWAIRCLVSEFSFISCYLFSPDDVKLDNPVIILYSSCFSHLVSFSFICSSFLIFSFCVLVKVIVANRPRSWGPIMRWRRRGQVKLHFHAPTLFDDFYSAPSCYIVSFDEQFCSDVEDPLYNAFERCRRFYGVLEGQEPDPAMGSF